MKITSAKKKRFVDRAMKRAHATKARVRLGKPQRFPRQKISIDILAAAHFQ